MVKPFSCQCGAASIAFARQSSAFRSEISQDLKLVLQWWGEILKLKICEERPWFDQPSDVAHLFADARSTPPRIAAVLIR